LPKIISLILYRHYVCYITNGNKNLISINPVKKLKTMKNKIVLGFIALAFCFTAHAQCTTTPLAVIFEESPVPPSTTPSYGLVVYKFPPNSLVYIYSPYQLVDSVYTDASGGGGIVLSDTSWAAPFFNTYNIGITPGIAVSGVCSTNLEALGTVPVKLTSFAAELVNNAVNCNWKTDNEIPGTLYQLQESTNGVDYTTMYSIKSPVTSSYSGSGQYQYSLPQIPGGKQFFRVEYTEPDGTSGYSEVEVVITENSLGLSVYPSVVHGDFSVSVSGNYINGQLKVYNVNGSTVYQNKITNSEFEITPTWSAGLYYIRAMAADGSSSIKTIVVQ